MGFIKGPNGRFQSDGKTLSKYQYERKRRMEEMLIRARINIKHLTKEAYELGLSKLLTQEELDNVLDNRRG